MFALAMACSCRAPGAAGKKLAFLLVAIAGLAGGVVVPCDSGRPHRPHAGPYYGDRDRDGVQNRADRDRDGVPNRHDRRPDKSAPLSGYGEMCRDGPPNGQIEFFEVGRSYSGVSQNCPGSSMKKPVSVLLFLLFGGLSQVHAQSIGEVDTVFKLLGPDHKIVVDAHDDPKVKGVTCYVSRAKTGGIKGALGLAEDKSEASIDCRPVGPVSFAKPLPVQEEVFSERISLIFKKIRIVRMVDSARNTLVYLTYSDRLIEGSPQNSVAAVPVDRAMKIPMQP